jgi:hypothetical protein
MKGCFKFVIITFGLLCAVSFGLYSFSPVWRERMTQATETTNTEAQAALPQRTFSQILGKGPQAADAWLGKPRVGKDGTRSYNAGGYGLLLWFNGDSLTRITMEFFPDGKVPKTPNDVARLLGPDVRPGHKNERGILEHYFCSSEAGVWELLLTPGDAGYSLINVTPPPGS